MKGSKRERRIRSRPIWVSKWATWNEAEPEEEDDDDDEVAVVVAVEAGNTLATTMPRRDSPALLLTPVPMPSYNDSKYCTNKTRITENL